jgi:hypothetical protein
MRRSAPPGAFGADQGSRHPVEPSPASRKRKRSPSDARRDQARAEKQQRRSLEVAVQDRRDIRNEREPLARRHLPASERHIAPDEMAGRDWTRKHRVEAVTVDVEAAYEAKRGAGA